jgi:hypothetical protein
MEKFDFHYLDSAPIVRRNTNAPAIPETLRIDSLNVALRLWTMSSDIAAGQRTVFRARQQIDLWKAYSR